MDKNDFLNLIAEQFDDIDVTSLSFETKFRELEEYSSLVALLIISMIDEEYGITLTGDDMRKFVTIDDIYNYISSK